MSTPQRMFLACECCGRVRNTKTDSKHPETCRECQSIIADVPLTDADILTRGRWVKKRGILKWESDGRAQPTPRVRRGTSRVQHGTDSGYHSHRRQTYGWPKEACQPCKQAHAAKQSETARVKREEAAA